MTETVAAAPTRAPLDEVRVRRALDGLLPVLLLVGTVLLLTRRAADPVFLPDTWFHLRIGERFASGEWRLVEPGSLSPYATEAWLPTSWLAQVLSWEVYQVGGLPAVAWVYGALQVALPLVLYRVCRAGAGPLESAVAAGMATLAALLAVSIRPQVVSLLLLPLVLRAWLDTVRDGRLRWWLLPVFWGWATVHGFWNFGLLTGGLVLAGAVLDRTTTARNALRAVAMLLGCVAAVTATPLGWRVWSTQTAVAERTSLISEWQPPAPGSPTALVAWGLVLGVALAGLARRRLSWTSLLLTALSVACVLTAVRLLAVAGVVLALVLAAELSAARRVPTAPVTRRERRGLAGLLAAALLVLAAALPVTGRDPGFGAAALAPELSALPAGTVVLTSAFGGSWMSWAHPELDHTIDGMFDAYPVQHMRSFKRAGEGPGQLRAHLRRTDPDYALVDRDLKVRSLLRQAGWPVVAARDGWFLLRAP